MPESKDEKDEPLLEDLEELEKDFATGIASVEDLINGDE